MPSQTLLVSGVSSAIFLALILSFLLFLYKRRKRASSQTDGTAGSTSEPQYHNTAEQRITHRMPALPSVNATLVQPPQGLFPLGDATFDKLHKKRLASRPKRGKGWKSEAGKQKLKATEETPKSEATSPGVYSPMPIPFTPVLTSPAGQLSIPTDFKLDNQINDKATNRLSASSESFNGSNYEYYRTISLSTDDGSVDCKGDTTEESDFEVVMENPRSAESQHYGEVEFTVTFNTRANHLEFQVISIKNLPLVKNGREPNPVAKVYFIHGERKFTCDFAYSKHLKGTCNPQFNDKIVFEVPSPKVLATGLIRVKVLDKESITHVANLGEIRVDLSENPEVLDGEKHVRSMLPKQDFRGELQVSVCHQATSAKLYVRLIKARFLQKVSHRNPKGFFVVIELRFKESNIVRKYITKIKRKNRHPVFAEDVIFDVNTDSAQTLDDFSLVLTLYKQEALKKTTLVGHVILGKMSLIRKEAEHWKSVSSSPHIVVTHWHYLH